MADDLPSSSTRRQAANIQDTPTALRHSESRNLRLSIHNTLTPVLLLGYAYVSADASWMTFSPLKYLNIAYSPLFDYTPLFALILAGTVLLLLRKRFPLPSIILSLLVSIVATPAIIWFPLLKADGLHVQRFLTEGELATAQKDLGFAIAQPRMDGGRHTLYIAKDQNHLKQLKTEVTQFKGVLAAT